MKRYDGDRGDNGSAYSVELIGGAKRLIAVSRSRNYSSFDPSCAIASTAWQCIGWKKTLLYLLFAIQKSKS